MSNKKQRNKEICALEAEKNRPLNELHSKTFPEEYDFYYDSNVEAKARKRGENPMNEQYQLKVNLRRFALGVEPYGGTVGVDNTEGLISSHEYCSRQLQKT
ncbi:hypothetical protein [Psychromonas sp. MME2]|uniref:hypothetical protein n=1 Tax=unclassified Psychromonas TaxID=2614957 RepID=UPI00339C5C8F